MHVPTELRAPEVWVVVWPGDETLGAQIADFQDWMLHSDYWMTSMGEYGIGAGTWPTPRQSRRLIHKERKGKWGLGSVMRMLSLLVSPPGVPDF